MGSGDAGPGREGGTGGAPAQVDAQVDTGFDTGLDAGFDPTGLDTGEIGIGTGRRRPSRSPHRVPVGGTPDDAAWSATDRFAVRLTHRLGAMSTVWATLLISGGWMVLGARAVLGFDPYPYPVLLFVGNVVQLLLIFVILVGQRILSAAGDRRAQQTYDDAQAILAECHRLQEHIETQNRVLNRAAPVGRELDPCDTAPIRITPPRTHEPETTSASRRLAAWLVGMLGSTGAVVMTTVIVAAWVVLALGGVIPDPYPFPFLLFCSSLAQLVLMFVIMVGQDVLGRTAERRVLQTAEHTAVVLQQCRHLRQHLVAQDEVIATLVERLDEADRVAGGPSAPAPRSHTGEHDGSRSGR